MKKFRLVWLLTLVAGTTTAHAQWQQQDVHFGQGLARVQAISIVSPSVVFVTSGGNVAGYTNFSRTNDGGSTWVRGNIDATPADVSLAFAGISALDANNVWAAAYSVETVFSKLGGGYVFYSRNGGTTWTYQSTAAFAGSAAFLNGLHMFDLRNGVVVGDPNGGSFEVYTTANGGTQWTRVSATALPAPLTAEAGLTGVLAASGSSVWFGTNLGRVYHSTDKGVGWQVSDTGLPEVKQLAFSDARNGLALYNDAGTGTITLSRTADGGQTWTTLTPSGPVYASGLAQVPGRPGTFVSTGLAASAAGSSVSSDYGHTWQQLDKGTPHGTVAFYDAQTGWTGGLMGNLDTNFTGGIYRSTATLLPTRAALPSIRATLYPNPARAAATLVLAGLPATTTQVQATLLDATGRTVGQHTLGAAGGALPLAALAPGLYVVRLAALDAQGRALGELPAQRLSVE